MCPDVALRADRINEPHGRFRSEADTHHALQTVLPLSQ
jgi:hypothetical protein